MDEMKSSRMTWQVIVGATVLLLGIVFLLDNFDLIDVGPVWQYWPLIFVAMGLSKIVQAENSWERRRGFWWTFIGLWLFVSVVHIFGLTFRDSWPILLIGAGISMIWKSLIPEPGRNFAKD
jgi:hypothetical protein